MNNNEKPMILLWKECCEKISNTINESKLSPIVLESILKDALSQVQNAIRIEYNNASLSYYHNSQSDSEKSNE